MGKQFEGQVAAITGGGAGLGLSIAKRLAAEGARVALIDLKRESLEAAAVEIGDNGRAYPCDVTSELEVGSIIGQIASDSARRVG